jgi:hypothetical protein
MLERFSLDTINNLSNLISLCRPCHIEFDNYLIVVHPIFKSLIISESIRGEVNVTQGGIPFLALHGKVVQFNGDSRFQPTIALLTHRYEVFESKITKKSKTAVSKCYCHLCPAVYITDQEVGEHMSTAHTDITLMSISK